MSAPLLALLIPFGLLGYWIAGRVGAFGLWKLGEGEMSNRRTMVRNSGDSAAPSPPEKRLFMVGGRRNGKRWVDTGKETAA